MKRLIATILSIALSLSLLCGCAAVDEKVLNCFAMGYGEVELSYGDMSEYYIAGYKNGRHPEGILDGQKVKAVYISAGKSSALLITVDCVGLDGGTVNEIRSALSNFKSETGCELINVISTHTHAGVDTLGLWGNIGINGKNVEFIGQIVEACKTAADLAYGDCKQGRLFFGKVKTEGMQRDSREPIIYDDNIYQLRFQPIDGTKGIRLISFAAHAESLRGDNLLISADFPAELSRLIEENCQDRTVFLAGAIGGLIMTPKFIENDDVLNMQETARRLYEYVLAIKEERELNAKLDINTVKLKTKLENTLFKYYKFLGILGNDAHRNILGEYILKTELTLMNFDGVMLTLLPGEVFPEIVLGEGGLNEIAKAYGVNDLIPIGLANDEIGYIIPSNDFLLSELAPYVVEADGHYEETNSVGKNAAEDLKKAFERAINRIFG